MLHMTAIESHQDLEIYNFLMFTSLIMDRGCSDCPQYWIKGQILKLYYPRFSPDPISKYHPQQKHSYLFILHYFCVSRWSQCWDTGCVDQQPLGVSLSQDPLLWEDRRPELPVCAHLLKSLTIKHKWHHKVSFRIHMLKGDQTIFFSRGPNCSLLFKTVCHSASTQEEKFNSSKSFLLHLIFIIISVRHVWIRLHVFCSCLWLTVPWSDEAQILKAPTIPTDHYAWTLFPFSAAG